MHANPRDDHERVLSEPDRVPGSDQQERRCASANNDQDDPAHDADRRRLQAALDQFMAIEREISPELERGKNSKSSKKRQP
jgi:hypothetical protein